MGYKIRVTPLGAKDLEEIVTYMTQELDNADAAASFLMKWMRAMRGWKRCRFCLKNVTIPRLKALQYRRAIIRRYVMVYRVDEAEKAIYVLRFFYGARDYEKLI